MQCRMNGKLEQRVASQRVPRTEDHEERDRAVCGERIVRAAVAAKHFNAL